MSLGPEQHGISTPACSLSRGGFPKGRIALDPENVLGCVHIAVMDRSAFAASPLSHTQALSAFRAAPRLARRTGLRTVPLICFDIFSPVRNRFVAEHRSKGRPTRVRDGFCHPGFHEFRGINVAHNDAGVSLYKSRGLLMEMMPAPGGNLRVDGSDAALVSSAAGDGQLIFKAFEVPRVLDARPIAENSQILQPEINADFATPFGWGRLNLTNKIQEPPASSVGGKAAAFDGAGNVARQKQAVFSFEKYSLVAIDFDDATTGIKRHPWQRFLIATIARAALVVFTRFRNVRCTHET